MKESSMRESALYLRNLSDKLMHVPASYGVNQYDVDELLLIANAIEGPPALDAELVEFVEIYDMARQIVDSGADWETKYQLIFSNRISRRAQSLVAFDWYDPDTSEEEDVREFMRAFEEKAENVRKALL